MFDDDFCRFQIDETTRRAQRFVVPGRSVFRQFVSARFIEKSNVSSFRLERKYIFLIRRLSSTRTDRKIDTKSIKTRWFDIYKSESPIWETITNVYATLISQRLWFRRFKKFGGFFSSPNRKNENFSLSGRSNFFLEAVTNKAIKSDWDDHFEQFCVCFSTKNQKSFFFYFNSTNKSLFSFPSESIDLTRWKNDTRLIANIIYSFSVSSWASGFEIKQNKINQFFADRTKPSTMTSRRVHPIWTSRKTVFARRSIALHRKNSFDREVRMSKRIKRLDRRWKMKIIRQSTFFINSQRKSKFN